MTDKDVERNVRSTTEEGIRPRGPLPKQHGNVQEEHGQTFSEKTEARKKKDKLLEKFRNREQVRKGDAPERGDTGERGVTGSDGPED